MSSQKASIDMLAPTRSLIDLDDHSRGTFSLGEDFELSFVFDDIVLVEFIDEAVTDGGTTILRGGIHVPVNSLNKAWRKAKVILAGPGVRHCKVDDIVIFPNDKGATVSNIMVTGHGKIKHGVFLNEQRLFGKCTQV